MLPSQSFINITVHIMLPKTDNCPFFYQWKGENDRRKYFMDKYPQKHASQWATETGIYKCRWDWCYTLSFLSYFAQICFFIFIYISQNQPNRLFVFNFLTSTIVMIMMKTCPILYGVFALVYCSCCVRFENMQQLLLLISDLIIAGLVTNGTT